MATVIAYIVLGYFFLMPLWVWFAYKAMDRLEKRVPRRQGKRRFDALDPFYVRSPFSFGH
ncbi:MULTISPECIES: hypothetical protein [Microvirgula]|uniref:Uncharacterized protein n=1 Tax=Microvirgula aerodenitrificans TaxID=57480 RepID=A0A2U3THC7_9NEIS|nr:MULTISPECIES: hypothetical protein [Microvirgula]AVY92814.1 hypothetical protein DAI18_01230 [Microvirgula aerodenitrificans]RAS17563.1 hypothetical protein DFO50_103173 [Microvirgula sp. AG722]